EASMWFRQNNHISCGLAARKQSSRSNTLGRRPLISLTQLTIHGRSDSQGQSPSGLAQPLGVDGAVRPLWGRSRKFCSRLRARLCGLLEPDGANELVEIVNDTLVEPVELRSVVAV